VATQVTTTTQPVTVAAAPPPILEKTVVQKTEKILPTSSETIPPPFRTTQVLESPVTPVRSIESMMGPRPPQPIFREATLVNQPGVGRVLEKSVTGPGFRAEERIIGQPMGMSMESRSGFPLVSDRYLQGIGGANGPAIPGPVPPTAANIIRSTSFQPPPPQMPNISVSVPPAPPGVSNSYTGIANSMEAVNRPSFAFLAGGDSQGPSVLGTNTIIS
jgi:hypothetical protein